MLKVFLVEDESLIREGLKENIPWEQYGYEFVGDASDGEMALPLIRQTKPDVLITDIKMPFMDGLSLSKIVSDEFPKTKIIIISGYDDFEYARQAIEVGAMQYLLKPITKMNLRKTLLELKEKIEAESEQNDYQKQYQSEMHEYEQFARRHFFEKLFQSDVTVKQIYEEAAKQSLEIAAGSYNLVFYYLKTQNEQRDTYSADLFLRYQDEIMHYIMRHPQYIPFVWNVDWIGILVKADQAHVEELTQRCVEKITQVCENAELLLEWYIAFSQPVERLSMLHESYQKVNHYMAYRFITPDRHILSDQTLLLDATAQKEKGIDNVDPANVDPQVIRDFLNKGSYGEIDDFVESFLLTIQAALSSKMFMDYIILHIRFTVSGFLDGLGIEAERYQPKVEEIVKNGASPERIHTYFVQLLELAVRLRDEESDFQGRKILHKAQEYIKENYQKETLSLNEVASTVGVSASYLSSVFSQSTQYTFIEYVTEKRMEKAKQLLKSTELSSGEISSLVGYKDPHYFSFVFKKTQGLSPREYRNGKKV